MDILSLYPAVKETIWGGRTLADDFGFVVNGDNAAEAWLLSCHKDGLSTVLNGEYKGLTLAAVIEKEGSGCLGTHNADKNGFPILIKLIDAKNKLSVQVHPDDAYAREHENENGKTEAWFILSCKKNASLIRGVKHNMSRGSFAQAIKDGSLLDNLNSVKVKPGDIVYIPSGTLHAIGSGILLAEVQQSSNTTYRVFDYNRKDKNGNTRQLHIDKAVAVADLRAEPTDFSPTGPTESRGDAKITFLTGCEYFKMYSVELCGKCELTADKSSFVSLLVLDGEGEIFSDSVRLTIKKGSSLFIPASYGKYTIEGKLSLLQTTT